MRSGCHPEIDDFDGIPHDFAISCLGRCGREDAKQADDGEDDRDDNNLDVLGAGFLRISREIGNVQTQGGVVAQYSVEIYERGFG